MKQCTGKHDKQQRKEFRDMDWETVCVDKGWQQVSLQEKRVNNSKEMAGDVAVELLWIVGCTW